MPQKTIVVPASGTGAAQEVANFVTPRTITFRGVTSLDKINVEISQDNSSWSTLQQLSGPDPGPITTPHWFAHIRAKRIAGTGACSLSIGAQEVTENDPRVWNFNRKAGSMEDTDADPIIVGRVKEPVKMLNAFFALREDVITTADDYFTLSVWTKRPAEDWQLMFEYICQNVNLPHTQLYGFNPGPDSLANELPENTLIGFSLVQAGVGVASPDIYVQVEGVEFTPNT